HPGGGAREAAGAGGRGRIGAAAAEAGSRSGLRRERRERRGVRAVSRFVTSPDQVAAALLGTAYVADPAIAATLFLADALDRPILVEGPAGVGKTELAKATAAALGTELLRLQCYEGLDEARTLYEWKYPKQLLYTQILRDHLGAPTGGATDLREAAERGGAHADGVSSDHFLQPRPLLQAIRADRRVVLLIDEV